MRVTPAGKKSHILVKSAPLVPRQSICVRECLAIGKFGELYLDELSVIHPAKF